MGNIRGAKGSLLFKIRITKSNFKKLFFEAGHGITHLYIQYWKAETGGY
jgi:hypothetical protein